MAIALRLPPIAPALGLALVPLNPFVLSAVGLELLLIPATLVGLPAAAVGVGRVPSGCSPGWRC